MSTYYTIHCYDQESKYHCGEDLIDNHILYKTFDRACDALEERIRYYESEFESPNREEKAKYLSKRPYVHYYETDFLFVISKMTVENDPTKYKYQYWVENKICGLHTKSDMYASFDEACDALDMELSQLYEVEGKEPLQGNRLVIKTLLEKSSTTTYAYYNDGSLTDKYVLSRQEV